ncbi:MAG: flagellar export chaperone FliS [Bacteroidetes bacterium]|nr:flagellar export chaperone FliS [Bacteroidota bacterium]
MMMLLDGSIRFMNAAKSHIQTGDFFEAHKNIIKAVNIVDELNTTLNMKYPISQDLRELYEFMHDWLIKADLEKSIQKVDDTLELMKDLRETWDQVIQMLQKEA